jgi:hypothetical protein
MAFMDTNHIRLPLSLSWDFVEAFQEVTARAKSTFHACMWGYVHNQNSRSCRSSGQWGQQPSAYQIQHAQSIDQKLAQLTKGLELIPEQRQQVRPLLQEHHDKIQALFDKNPTASRQELGPQIHAISDETHRKIHALLTDHQKIGKGDAVSRA